MTHHNPVSWTLEDEKALAISWVSVKSGSILDTVASF